MGRFFSDAVETALRDLYYQMWTGRWREAFRLLEQASDAGDGDASCLLARCLCGGQYVWDGHGFPEDGRLATGLLHKSVEQGSALGVLICLRSGELKDVYKRQERGSADPGMGGAAFSGHAHGGAVQQVPCGNQLF